LLAKKLFSNVFNAILLIVEFCFNQGIKKDKTIANTIKKASGFKLFLLPGFLPQDFFNFNLSIIFFL
jgi:hypothetical protein